MRVLVVGSGGREHAFVWALSQSPQIEQLFCAPGNAGTASLAVNLPIGSERIDALAAAAVRERIDLAVIGPEAPLAAGLVDALRERDIRVFGPTRAAARIEASKRFAKSLMERAGVSHARGRSFHEARPAHAFIDSFRSPPVVKADGLAAGKGVVVPATFEEAHASADAMLGGRFGEASEIVVIEERLAGLEASAMAFVDGRQVEPMPLSCDYKRVGDGDVGPNTGGMGAYSPPGFLPPENTPRLFADIHGPVVAALAARDAPFQGALYAGLMVDEGAASVLEFNCRFGDPETQVVLPRLRTALLTVMEACTEGRLAAQPVEWSEDATVGVVLASDGYPGSYETGKQIHGLNAIDDDVQVFHAGTRLTEEGEVVTSGGRVLTVVARAPTLAEARARVYDNVRRIDFAGGIYRRDIAAREL